ncbi:MAG: hypothetical protein IJE07_10015 [Clostridia bacterium]|nr:hypothetical protein [Clostridia bacterium]
MKVHESFAQCLQRLLDEAELSASEAARLVGFRSRNSIFRILGGETSADVDARFLQRLHGALADSWPQQAWAQLEEALEIKRVGLQQHLSNQAFLQGMFGAATDREFMVEMPECDGEQTWPLDALLHSISATGEISIVICGCCERNLMLLLANCLSDAAADGRLTVRHYIDVSEEGLESRLMNLMPVLSKKWYNARLVDEAQCPAEMAAIYRLNMICVVVREAGGSQTCYSLLQCDSDRFLYHRNRLDVERIVRVLDRCRFQLELLKPRTETSEGSQPFVDYTAMYAGFERDCTILSIKPDVHFNLIPVELLYPAILDGFSQSGLVEVNGLSALMEALYSIHADRVRNMHQKHRPTQIIYSIRAMENFARTGVQSDHFFIQRAYTPQERRAILQNLRRMMEEKPYFNIFFLRPELPDIRCEMTFYEGRGVVLMDAYTSYDLSDDHSEAFITLPAFQRGFQRFFRSKLLSDMVLSRQESIVCIERMIEMIRD